MQMMLDARPDVGALGESGLCLQPLEAQKHTLAELSLIGRLMLDSN